MAESALGTTGDADLERARAGEAPAFDRLAGPLRGELHAHCYRMLGSAHDADDALQETLLRAWRGLAGFEGRGALRSWLYTVATRTCLDMGRARSRRALPMDLGPSSERAVTGGVPRSDVAWLGPYPDAALGSGPAGPGARYDQREAVELAFVAALQRLPGNQRAALLLFEVLGFSAAEIAAMMRASTAAVNSALARARRSLAQDPPSAGRAAPPSPPQDPQMRRLASGFADALERGDGDALVALLSEDVTWSMPPLPHWYQGLAAVADFAWRVPLTGCGSWRYRLTGANARPAVAFYMWEQATAAYGAWSITVLGARGDRIAEITSFLGAQHFAHFGLPARLD